MAKCIHKNCNFESSLLLHFVLWCFGPTASEKTSTKDPIYISNSAYFMIISNIHADETFWPCTLQLCALVPRHSLSPHSCMLTALKAIKQFLHLYHFQSWNECSRGSSICELGFWTFIFFPYIPPFHDLLRAFTKTAIAPKLWNS